MTNISFYPEKTENGESVSKVGQSQKNIGVYLPVSGGERK